MWKHTRARIEHSGVLSASHKQSVVQLIIISVAALWLWWELGFFFATSLCNLSDLSDTLI